VKFLLVKLNHIGDTLLMTPTIRWLRDTYPDAQIDVVVRKGCEGVLEANADISHIFTIARPERSKRKLLEQIKDFLHLISGIGLRRYDYAFDLSNSDRAKLILFLSAAKHRGINRWHNPITGWKAFLFTDFSDYAWGSDHQVLKDFRTVTDILGLPAKPGPLQMEVRDLLPKVRKRFGTRPKAYLHLHPVSRWSFKEWPPERWAKVLSLLLKKHTLQVVISSGPDPREIAVTERIATILQRSGFPMPILTRGETTLRELGALIGDARVFLGVDTVAMHIAAAVHTPTVALFGPSDEWSWHPWQVPHKVVLGTCPCKQTRRFVCDRTLTPPCLEEIAVENVVSAARELLDA